MSNTPETTPHTLFEDAIREIVRQELQAEKEAISYAARLMTSEALSEQRQANTDLHHDMRNVMFDNDVYAMRNVHVLAAMIHAQQISIKGLTSAVRHLLEVSGQDVERPFDKDSFSEILLAAKHCHDFVALALENASDDDIKSLKMMIGSVIPDCFESEDSAEQQSEEQSENSASGENVYMSSDPEEIDSDIISSLSDMIEGLKRERAGQSEESKELGSVLTVSIIDPETDDMDMAEEIIARESVRAVMAAYAEGQITCEDMDILARMFSNEEPDLPELDSDTMQLYTVPDARISAVFRQHFHSDDMSFTIVSHGRADTIQILINLFVFSCMKVGLLPSTPEEVKQHMADILSMSE